MNPSSSNWARAVEAVANLSAPLGVPPSYGLEGCKPYDMALRSGFADCTIVPPPEYCSLSWCYVDEEICQVRRMCLGSEVRPYCRDRPRKATQASSHVDFMLFYSYETCGNLDTYTSERVHEESFNVTYVATPMESRPWSFVVETSGEPVGIVTDLETAAVQVLHSDLIFMQDVTAASLQRFPTSSWSACLHDIAIGVVDMCFGDFWVSKERLIYVSFLPALYQDEFRLVAQTTSGDTMMTIMEQPFLPFEWELWISVFSFLIVAGLLLAFAEREHNEDDFPDPSWWRGALKGSYVAVMNFLAGGPVHLPHTQAGRFISMGIAFFVLIVLATYTANLASFLISDRSSGPISDLESALAKGLTVAIAEVPLRMLSPEYPGLADPGAHLVVPEGKEAAAIHSGRADVGIVAKSTLAKMYAGTTVTNDCEGQAAGDHKDLCPLDSDGSLDLGRDCDLQWVGEKLASLNVAVPVSKKHASALSWATEDVLNQGHLPVLFNTYSAQIPENLDICEHRKLVTKADRLPISALIGSMTVSGICVLVGFCVAACDKSLVKLNIRSADTSEQHRGGSCKSGVVVRKSHIEHDAHRVQIEPTLQQVESSIVDDHQAQLTEARNSFAQPEADLVITQLTQASTWKVQTETGLFTARDTLSTMPELRTPSQTHDDLSFIAKDLYALTRRVEKLTPGSSSAQVLPQALIGDLEEQPCSVVHRTRIPMIPKVQEESGLFATQNTLGTTQDLSFVLKDLIAVTRKVEELMPGGPSAQMPTPRPAANVAVLPQAVPPKEPSASEPAAVEIPQALGSVCSWW